MREREREYRFIQFFCPNVEIGVISQIEIVDNFLNVIEVIAENFFTIGTFDKSVQILFNERIFPFDIVHLKKEKIL
jgi:hypothetical protein